MQYLEVSLDISTKSDARCIMYGTDLLIIPQETQVLTCFVFPSCMALLGASN